MLRIVVVIVVVVEVLAAAAAVLRASGGLGVEEAVSKLLLLTLAANLKEGINTLDTCVQKNENKVPFIGDNIGGWVSCRSKPGNTARSTKRIRD